MPSQCSRGAVDSIGEGTTLVDRARDHLQQGGADPLRSAAADDELDATRRAHHERWGHHRGHPVAGRRRRGSPSGGGRPPPSCCWPSPPCPGCSQPDPSPFDVVMLAALPSASLHADVGRAAGGPPAGQRLPRPCPPPGPPRWPPSPRRAPRRGRRTRRSAGQPALRLELEQTERHQLPAERGRRVGEEAVAAPARRRAARARPPCRPRGRPPSAGHRLAAMASPMTSARAPARANPRSSSEPRKAASAGFTRRSPRVSRRPPGATIAAASAVRVRIGSRIRRR